MNKTEKLLQITLIITLIFLISAICFTFIRLNNMQNSQNCINKLSPGDTQEIIGRWQEYFGDRMIFIKTDNLTLKEVVNVARHEVCHEIYFRINKNQDNNRSEIFADKCEPIRYINRKDLK